MSTKRPHPSLRWIARMPFERCGAVWRVRVPEAPLKYTCVDVYDHEHGGSAKRALTAARRIRDELASTMPFPLTAIVRQYRDGTFALTFRYEPERDPGPVWSATYYRLDEVTHRPRAAMLSRSVHTYGHDGARDEVERAWRAKVMEQAQLVDRLVRRGVPVLQHGPTSGEPQGRGSRARVNGAQAETLATD